MINNRSIAFSTKIEKEKKQQAKEAGMVRTEVSGHEVILNQQYSYKCF